MMKNNQPNFCIIYSTFPTKAEADKISSILIEEKLCACVNIFAPIDSVYLWQGKVEKSKEIPVYIKTKDNLFGKVSTIIKQNHSYDTPCIVKIKIEDGDKDFLNWLDNSVETS